MKLNKTLKEKIEALDIVKFCVYGIKDYIKTLDTDSIDPFDYAQSGKGNLFWEEYLEKVKNKKGNRSSLSLILKDSTKDKIKRIDNIYDYYMEVTNKRKKTVNETTKIYSGKHLGRKVDVFLKIVCKV